MILAVDVAYHKNTATAGGILFCGWADPAPRQELVVPCTIENNYIPGQFYRKELPCIATLLAHISDEPDYIIIDGFVYLGRAKEPGLGKHLYDMLEQKVTVIGVAKTPYKDTPKSCEVLRGSSGKPLYITAVGMEEEAAKFLVKSMQGQGRIPTLLKYVDRLCRQNAVL